MTTLIVIPTFQRAGMISAAVEAALAQTHADRLVAVIDDGSTDGTDAICRQWFDRGDFIYLRLARNQGTAAAKNAALALLPFSSVTFHDSDDIAHPEKVARQHHVLTRTDCRADACLPWSLVRPDLAVDDSVAIDAVFSAHELVGLDGVRSVFCRGLSLVDDFFPNLQFGAGRSGDWVLINCGLFRREALARVGGYALSVEEDRGLRNRLIMHGAAIWLLPEVLMTKHECPDSLTVDSATNYDSSQRQHDRRAIWKAIAQWRSGGAPPIEPIALVDPVIGFVSRSDILRVADDLPMAQRTRARLVAEVGRLQGAQWAA